ncbi:MAG: cation:proton antiporter [Firmicutes bacterium]|nr:cation:proton antiporter [Bacillota bacterium]
MNFTELISMLSVVFLGIILVSYFNEKVVKLPNEIGFMTITLIASIVMLALEALGVAPIIKLANSMTHIDFHDVILGGYICYLLFSGSVSIKFKDLTHDRLLIASLAFISTLIAALIYATLTMVIIRVVGIEMTFIQACILGSIIAPTDPISAMSILKKAGLSERISLVIEGESLFNDGIAVALFVTFSSLNKSSTSGIATEFLGTIVWNIFGALFVGFVVSYILFLIFRTTNQKYIEILVSLTAVSMAYSISEHLEVSGPTAAVVVGIFFATYMSSIHDNNEEYYANFYTFWKVIDKILNGVLYIMIGIAALFLHNINGFIVIVITAIIMSLFARYISILGPIWLFSRNRNMIPQKYSKDVRVKDKRAMAKLLTWGGLKGGICIALALGTRNIFTPEQYDFVILSTYSIVVFTTLVQGLSIQKLYSRIKTDLC